MSSPLSELAEAGVSIWLDDLSRERIASGALHELITSRSVSGVTTNPTIFAQAFAKDPAYAIQLSELASRKVSADEAIFEATTDDVRSACDVFADVYAKSNGVDGRVSIEVEPGFAMDTEKTIRQAKQLHDTVGRENVMIKIPATLPGLEAISAVLAEGISVNVTLIFSLQRYKQVIDAYKEGLRRAYANGKDLSKIHSVASFFVSRVDTEIDKRLDAIGTAEALALKSKAAVANAQLAYALFEEEFSGSAWEELKAKGANLQRPLMASTGVKDPSLRDTLYVEELVGANLVNTMPEKTMEAVFDHGSISPGTISSDYDKARSILGSLETIGISYADVVEVLEQEGVEKFSVSWGELVATVSEALERKQG